MDLLIVYVFVDECEITNRRFIISVFFYVEFWIYFKGKFKDGKEIERKKKQEQGS